MKNLRGRNDPKGVGIAQRTRRNLEYIWHQVECGNAEVHAVAQLVNSLLGLVVVPQSRILDDRIRNLSIDDWPQWKVAPAETNTETLGCLIYHIRNAAAHGHFEFLGEPDSPRPAEVILTVEDGKPPQRGKAWKANWSASISGDDLYEFCLQLATLIEEHIEIES